MNTELEEQLKDWIRMNLVLEVHPRDPFNGIKNSVVVCLRFRGDEDVFSSEPIYIPDYPEQP